MRMFLFFSSQEKNWLFLIMTNITHMNRRTKKEFFSEENPANPAVRNDKNGNLPLEENR